MRTKAIGCVIIFCCLATITIKAQKFYTKTGKISFFSATAMENIAKRKCSDSGPVE